MKCFIQNCVNSDKINKISDGRATTPHRITFHTFPKDPKQRAAWLESLCIPSFTVTPKHVICSEHFKEDDLYQTKLGTRRVKYGVVPVINYDQQQPASRVCKLCLRIDAKMYDLNEDSLNKMYQYVVGIEPRRDSKDRFPMNICWECKSRLQSAAAFKTKALTSDQLLQEHLNYKEELNITEISKLYREHNLKSNLIIKELYNYDYEAINSTESDTFVKTETKGYAIEEVIDESSQIDEIVIKNENNVTEDDRKAEIDIAPSNSQDKFETEAPKVNWNNIILVKTPTITDYQFNISVFENNTKMAEDDQAIDDTFDMNMDDGNDVEEKVVVENTIRRGRRKKEEATNNRWIV
ncbi:hypothetical protein HF086_003198 [Spodoptera exigua]|uniref:THAP-type domain-containing protein n=1 Tax=Spodoptera exigua TaxID=7107 RepID=A0A922MF18_SPOEX|nr:hypothetical protein HF086_003198 [Spodoptera exigua]